MFRFQNNSLDGSPIRVFTAHWNRSACKPRPASKPGAHGNTEAAVSLRFRELFSSFWYRNVPGIGARLRQVASKPMKKSRPVVAFQGERGAFSFAAARKLLGPEIETYPCTSFKTVFEVLQSGTVTHAVIPIENTLHGSVHENYDHLVQYNLPIAGETSIRISHHLIALPGVRFRDLHSAFSHPVALNQCRRFFEKYKQIRPISFYDTAGSVKMLQEEKPSGAAAIASEAAAEIYGGVILKRNIEDDRQNFTRFFLLTKQTAKAKPAAGEWKTSIVFSTSNLPGALFRALACFALRDLNLAKIESRPLRNKPWEYLFYVDVLASSGDEKLQNAIGNLKEMTSFFKLLGSYRPTP